MTRAIAVALMLLPGLTAQITTPSPLPSGIATNSYSLTLAATGGTPPYSWTVTGGQLPDGLTLSSIGVISGTANTATIASFTIQVADGQAPPFTDSKSFSLTITPKITTAILPVSTVNQSYPPTSFSAAGLSSSSPLWSALGLPAGLSIDSGGNLSGTPTASGSFTPTFSVQDPSGAIGTATISLTINAAPTITDASPLPSADVALAYSYQFGSSPVSGGTAPFAWSTPSALPPGLALSADGILSGTPTTTGLFTFSIHLTDSAGAGAAKTFALLIGTLPVHVTLVRTPPNSTAGVPYPPPPAAGQPPYFRATQGTGTYAWTSAGLPPGLNLNPTTGSLVGLGGTPTVSGIFTPSVTATDPANESASTSFSFTINPTPAINVTPLQTCTAGTACTRTLTLTGGTAPFSWSLAGGALPPGLSLSSAGVISGTPSAVASPTNASFSVTVTDIATAANTQPLTLLVNPAIVISPATLPATTSGIAYSQTITTTGGTGLISFTATGLPGWLSLASDGTLTGTAPSVASTTPFPFSVTATDSDNATTTKAYTVSVNPLPAITTASPLAGWTVNVPYSRTIAASGGTGVLTFSDNGATLPNWLTISSAGLLSGTPTATGPVSFTLRVTDSLSAFSTKAFTLTINATPVVTTASLPDTTSGSSYNRTLAETGGTSPFNWQPTGLPSWLSLSSAGVLTGTAPSIITTTTYNFSVTVTDAANAQSVPQNLSVTVNPALQFTTTSPLPVTDSGLAYSQTLATSGGTGTVTMSSLNLPAWLSLTPDGVLSGTAPVVATSTPFNFTVTATDSVSDSIGKSFALTVNPAVTFITASPLPSWTVNQPYAQTIQATGGTLSFTFSDAAATLPAWLTISAGGALTGTPPSTGPFTFTLKVTDSISGSTTRNFTVNINPVPSVSTNSLPATTSGSGYNQTLAETGGTSSFVWHAVGLPAWLSLSSAGVLTGTAPAVGSATAYPFSVTVTDAASASSAPQNLSVTVNPALQITTSSPLPPAESGLAYSQTLATSGGTGTVTLSSVNLPSWLTISPGGALSGTAPVVASATTFNFNVTASDSSSSGVGKAFAVTVNPAVTIATASTLPAWTINRPYSQTITPSGGVSPYTFSDAGNTLPAWLTIAAGGALTGTPTVTGQVTFTLKVTDSLSGVATKTFTLNVNPAPSVTTNSLPATTSGRSYNQTLTSSGGTPAIAFSVAGLPTWLTLTGANLSGTAPSVVSSTPFNFSVTVMDSAGAVSTPQSLSVTVNPPVTITTSNPLPSAGSGVTYSQTFVAAGGTGAITWTFSGLPTWLSQSGATVSGTAPTVAQATPYTFNATATDSLGATSGSHSFTVTVGSGVFITTAATLGPWTATRLFTVTLAASGGTSPYTFSDPGQTLPPWLTLNGAVLSGTPPAAASVQFTIQAADSLFSTATKTFSLAINPAPAVTTTTLAVTTSGLPYSQPLAETGGTAPFTWSATNLPAWASISGAAIVGTAPNVASATPFPFSVKVTDSTETASNSQALTVIVNPPVTITTTSPLPPANPGTPYTFSFTGTGGTGALTWTAANLPSWLALNANILTGTPPTSAAGTAPIFSVTATDTLGAFFNGSYQITVGNGTQTNGGTLPAWTVNRPYSTSLTLTVGTAPYSNWHLTSGILPNGLQLNAATGAITGTPTVAGPISFGVSTTDSTQQVFLSTWTLTINPAPAIPTQSLPPASPGSTYSQALTRTGGTSPFTWTASGLTGSGLDLSANGVLSGILNPTSASAINFTATVTDAAGATAQLPLSLTVTNGVTITTTGLPATTSTAAYSSAVNAVGGTGTIVFSAATGTLPAWLTLTPQGKFTGTAPVVSQTTDFPIVVIATDSVNTSASKTLAVTVNPVPQVTTQKLPTGTKGAAYSAQLAATGGTGALVWSAQNLPAWASLNSSTGAISGTPPAVATVSISAVATDSLGIASPPASLSLEIDASGGTPLINSICPFAPTTAGLSFDQAASGSGGFPPYTWSATGLPSWMALSGSGAFSGTAAAGVSVFTLKLTDAQSQTATQACGVTVNPAPAVTPGSLAPGTIGAPYAQYLTAFGGTGVLTWSSSNLPGWLAIEPLTGALTGTPTAASTYTFSVQVTDSLGAVSAPVPFTVLITNTGGAPIITACPLPASSVGRPIAFQLTAALGFPPYQWSTTGLPAGLGANSTGIVTGTPSAVTSASVGLSVTDSAKVSASGACALNIFGAPLVTTANLPKGTVGAFYWQPLTATGGVGALHWTISGAPGWLTIDPVNGVLSGTPDSSGLSSLRVRVTDSQGTQSPAAGLSLNVTQPGGGLTVSSVCPLPPITQGMLLDYAFTASGGIPSYSWAATGLPAGISLSPGGILLGAPAAGTISFSVQATDQQQQQTSALSCSVVVNPAPAITTATLPNGVAGAQYTAQIKATGGTGLLAWTAAKPFWLAIDSLTGTLSGTPPAAGAVTATVRAADIYGAADSKTYSFTVAAPASGGMPALTSACPLPGAIVGVNYSQSLSASGGSSPYQYFISGLPTGLTFSSSGLISGTAQSSGTGSVLVEIIDAAGKTATASCGLSVTASTLSIVATTPDGKVNQSYSGALAASGGIGPFAWSITTGALPAGIALNPSTGALTGTPMAAGTFPFTATVTDSTRATASANASIKILASLTISTSANLPDALGGSAYKQTLAATGASGAVTWSIASGALPAGLALDNAAGVISGSPTQAGTFTVTVQVVDASKQQAQVTFTLKVNLAPLPQLTIAGVAAALTPNQQPTPVVTLASAYPLDITGQLNLTVTPDSSVGVADPAVKFSAGGASVPFRIAANSTTAVFTPSSSFQTGTLAASEKLDVALQTGGTAVQPPVSAAVTGQLPKLAPVIVGTPAVIRTSSGIQITYVAFATSREVTTATFHFTGTNLQASDVTISMTSLVNSWYGSSASNAYGGLFQIVQPFAVQGTPSQVTGLSMTLTNSVGTSTAVSVSF